MKLFVETVFLKLWVASSLVLLSTLSLAQDIPVGTWRTHFSYLNARILEATGDKIFCAAENGLFSLDIVDHSTRKLSKIDGLADLGVSVLKYDEIGNVLVVGYESGFVDFIFEDDLQALDEVANTSLEGDRRINDITFSPTRTFVGTSFGVLAVNTSEVEINETFSQIGIGGLEIEAIELEFLGNSLFVRTSDGIQSGDVSNNLLDFNNWIHYASTAGLSDLTLADGNLYARNNLDLYLFNGTTWNDTGVDLPTDHRGLFGDEGQLFTATATSILAFETNAFVPIDAISASDINDVVFADQRFWIADGSRGLITQDGESLSPAGPFLDTYSRLRVDNNIAYGFHAPEADTYNGSIRVQEFSQFEEGNWSVRTIPNFQNISDVAVFGGMRYFSSIGDGFYDEVNEEAINDIPGSSSELDTIITSIAVGDGLWISSFANQNPIHRFDGQDWTSFTSVQLIDNQFVDLSVSLGGILWTRRSDQLVTVFDREQGQSASITTANGLPGAIADVEISTEDNAWVATSAGPATFSDASFIFQNNEAILPSFENATLFEGETINAIETDGGNRVWFATERGLWLFDENISELVARFDFDNSPLPSDQVLDLAYNEVNGEMFVLTVKGLVSFRSASSAGSVAHSNVNIFPNPVRPEYVGLVGIEGLARNASVKITDINGNLVQEVRANGGSASWNLRNLRNLEVATGVYLIFSSSDDGEETFVGKIAVIR